MYSIFKHAVHLSIHPGRLILLPFRKWFEKKYAGQYKFDRAVFSLDVVLISFVVALFSIALFLILVPPKQFRDDILFTANVAPREVISGGSSTLVIDFRNNTNEILRNPKLDLTFPKHFLLQSVLSKGLNVDARNIPLDNIPVGGTGTIHVQGVMFGDVGGAQTFGSTLNFTHGTEKDMTDRTSAQYTFSPTRSTLSLALDLPENVIASQTMSGVITYKNTGTIDYREVHIKPEWPNGFMFQDASAQIRNDAFVLSNIKAGSSGEIHFTGKLGNISEQLTFNFSPSIIFTKDAYQQSTLTKSVPVLAAHIQLNESVETNVITPGTNAVFHVRYKHTGNETLRNVSIGLTSRDPFLTKLELFAPTIDVLKPGDAGDLTFTIPVHNHVDTNLLTAFENLRVRTQAVVRYTIEGKPNAQITTLGEELKTPLTTPFNFESFARYTSPGGDQIGRGPLPPRVGQKTSYWIFWHIDDTTNPINNLVVEGTLPENVSFTGHKTASEGEGVTFDPATRRVRWNVSTMPSTLDPSSKVFSVAFEVALIPTENQVKSRTILVKNVHFEGTDGVTGVKLETKKADISTNLPEDQKANQKGIVRP